MWQVIHTVCVLLGSDISCATGTLPFEFKDEASCKAAAFYLSVSPEELEAKEKSSKIPLSAMPEGKCVKMERS